MSSSRIRSGAGLAPNDDFLVFGKMGLYDTDKVLVEAHPLSRVGKRNRDIHRAQRMAGGKFANGAHIDVYATQVLVEQAMSLLWRDLFNRHKSPLQRSSLSAVL